MHCDQGRRARASQYSPDVTSLSRFSSSSVLSLIPIYYLFCWLLLIPTFVSPAGRVRGASHLLLLGTFSSPRPSYCLTSGGGDAVVPLPSGCYTRSTEHVDGVWNGTLVRGVARGVVRAFVRLGVFRGDSFDPPPLYFLHFPTFADNYPVYISPFPRHYKGPRPFSRVVVNPQGGASPFRGRHVRGAVHSTRRLVWWWRTRHTGGQRHAGRDDPYALCGCAGAWTQKLEYELDVPSSRPTPSVRHDSESFHGGWGARRANLHLGFIHGMHSSETPRCHVACSTYEIVTHTSS
ncbi:hypothetical protein B0H11DRAFT_2299857 [Mycena galericulata]|nr:hypothetical protein B0H11DRAFT_2299857 [Mycena galericulata]